MNLTDLPVGLMGLGIVAWLAMAIFFVIRPVWLGPFVVSVYFLMPVIIFRLMGGMYLPVGQLLVITIGPIILLGALLRQEPLPLDALAPVALYGLVILLSMLVNDVGIWQYKSAFAPLLFAALIALAIREPRSIHYLLAAFFFFVLLNTVIGGLQVAGFSQLYHLTHSEEVEGSGFRRGTGIATHFSQVGLYCAGAAPLLLARGLVAARRSRRLLWLASTVVPFAGILFSGLRAAFIGMALGILTVFLKWDLKKAPQYLLVLVILGALATSALPVLKEYSGNLKAHLTTVDDSAAARPRLAMMGLTLFAESPVVGRGPASFKRVFGGVGDAHNTYANVLADYGLLGLLGFVWANSAAILAILRTCQRRQDSDLYPAGLGLLGCMVAVMSVAFFHSVNYITTYWIFPALGLGLGMLPQSRTPAAPPDHLFAEPAP
ncbi:MAG: O-antigen ligase family protein [Thermodesulfobacteriota bacterium]